MLIVNGISYPIVMLGYIEDRQLLFEMIDMDEETAESIFGDAMSIKFLNSDGVLNDLSRMKFVGFLDGASAGNVLVILK